MNMIALLVAAWVYAPTANTNIAPIYFATEAACQEYAKVRGTVWARCFPTGAP